MQSKRARVHAECSFSCFATFTVSGVLSTTDLPARQPSDGYQILDEVSAELATGTSTTTDERHHRHHHHHQQQQQQQQQQQPGANSTSGSEDSSSEFGNVHD